MLCPYCNLEAELVAADDVFTHDSLEAFRLSSAHIWLCRPCHAWAACSGDGKLQELMGDIESHEWRFEASQFLGDWMKYNNSNSEGAAEHFRSELGLDKFSIPWLTDYQCRQVVDIACQVNLEQRFCLTP